MLEACAEHRERLGDAHSVRRREFVFDAGARIPHADVEPEPFDIALCEAEYVKDEPLLADSCLAPIAVLQGVH